MPNEQESLMYATLEQLNKSIDDLLKGYLVKLEDLEKINEQINSIRKDINDLSEQRNELVKQLNDIKIKINEDSGKLSHIISEFNKTVNPNMISTARSVIKMYSYIVDVVGEENIKNRYPDLYKFVNVMSNLIEESSSREVNMWEVLEEGTENKSASALMFMFKSNYVYAKEGKPDRVTQAFAARKYGIREQTLNRLISQFVKQGIIVKVVPLTSDRKYEYEFAFATTKRGNDYYRNVNISVADYEKKMRKEIKKKHY